MSFAGTLSCTKQNLSAPSLFTNTSMAAVSRDTLERAAKQAHNISSPSRVQSPAPRVKFTTQEKIENHEIVTINVSGRRYQTYLSTLQRFPETLLGDPKKRRHFFNQQTDEYFFDRHRKAFGGILYYYQSEGEIDCPSGVSENIFAQEILFFDLYDKTLLDHTSDSSDEDFEVPNNPILAYIWILFEKPKSSFKSKIIAVFSILVIALSIIVFCLETIPNLDPDTKHGKHMKTTWKLLNEICNAWFTVEFCLRFISSPRKITFLRSPVNLIDLLSILPFYLTMCIGDSGGGSIEVLRVIRVIRVIRIFKLTRHSRGLHILANTIKASFQELLMLVLFLAIAVILFASAVYFAEHHGGGHIKFKSIPHSFWWAVITMTTVGYGDLSPTTLVGQFVGTLCAISGVLVIALPVPVIVSNFEFFYKQEQSRQARETEINKKEQEEETFADMRKSIQLMTSTSIILAGGIQQKNNGINNGDGGNIKSLKEKIQDKFSFTFQKSPFSDIEQSYDEIKSNGKSPMLPPSPLIMDSPLIITTPSSAISTANSSPIHQNNNNRNENTKLWVDMLDIRNKESNI